VTMTVSGTVLLFEGGLALVFMTLLLLGQKKGGGREDSLWGLVWATRLFASLHGSRHMSANGAELLTYIGLQACSGLSLMLILSRYELKVFKDKLMNRLLLQVAGAGGVGPRRVLPGDTTAGPR
jgi:hypothetical protein